MAPCQGPCDARDEGSSTAWHFPERDLVTSAPLSLSRFRQRLNNGLALVRWNIVGIDLIDETDITDAKLQPMPATFGTDRFFKEFVVAKLPSVNCLPSMPMCHCVPPHVLTRPTASFLDHRP
jgi:hypothetical protein